MNYLGLSIVGEVPDTTLRSPGFSPTKCLLEPFDIEQGYGSVTAVHGVLTVDAQLRPVICRSLELQSNLIWAACQCCYTFEGAQASTLASWSFDRGGIEAFGGVQAMLMCLVNPPTDFARRCIIAVLLDVAQEAAASRDASFASFQSSKEFTRCVAFVQVFVYCVFLPSVFILCVAQSKGDTLCSTDQR
jgi:hypothetical protein